MKFKILLLFAFLSAGINCKWWEILSELKGLNAEYESLVKEEEARFQKRKRTFWKRAAAQNIELEKLKVSIEEKLATAPEERKNKIFKDTFWWLSQRLFKIFKSNRKKNSWKCWNSK